MERIKIVNSEEVDPSKIAEKIKAFKEGQPTKGDNGLPIKIDSDILSETVKQIEDVDKKKDSE